VKPDATYVICCPTSPNDGKRVRVVSEHGYNPRTDAYEQGFVEVELLDTGIVGSIDRRFLTAVQ